jgi:hypothetical protein
MSDVTAVIGALILSVGSLAHAADGGTPRQQLSFIVQEGRNLNSLLRSESVAAHLLLRSGTDPRISNGP